jgi:hypothetical protein
MLDSRVTWTAGVMFVLGATMFASVQPDGTPATAAGDIDVLNARTVWRCHATYRPVDGQCIKATVPKPRRWVRWGEQLAAPCPPAGWMTPDFDDSGWPRQRGPFLGGYGGGRYVGTMLLCVRGRFGVVDPAKAKGFTLALTYRGGAVAYVNGKELARGHMPDGDVAPDTPAADYPREVFVTPDGEATLPDYGRRNPPAEVLDRYEARIRRLRVAIPAEALRKGTNVLALELHRTRIPPDLPTQGRGVQWDTVGLLEARLTAPAGSGVQPNVGAPAAGVRIWNAAPLLRVGVDADDGDPFEPLGPIRLTAPINGFASGQVVVSAAADVKLDAPLSAKAGALKSPGGGAIPPGAIAVRYARPSHGFVALLDRPPDAKEAQLPLPSGERRRAGKDEPPQPAPRYTQPIWLTVKVPADARPGKYDGELNIDAPGGTRRLPVELTVCGWRVGDPKDWRTCVNILQSPESVAGYYKVPMWSDRHFELMAPSLALMGQAGNDVLGIQAIGQTVFGNDPMLVFRRSGPGPADYAPDLKFVERYLRLYDRLAGRPQFLCLNVWSYGMYRRGAGRDGGKEQWRTETIPIAELRGDRVEPAKAPIYGEPGTEAMWRPAMDGLRAIVRKLGWSERCVLLGTSGDGWPSEITVSFFKKIAPYARWRAITHGGGVPRWGPSDAERTQPNGMVVGYCELVRRITNTRDKVPDAPVTCNARDCVKYDPFHYRSLPGTNVISANFDGVCWKGLDYWTYTDAEGRQRCPLNSYVHFGNIVGSTPRTMALPGEGGAVPTVQFEMLREGIQDCEALILLRDALSEPARRSRLGEHLAGRCETAMEDFLCLLETGHRYEPQGGGDVRYHVARLYEVAAEAARALRAR